MAEHSEYRWRNTADHTPGLPEKKPHVRHIDVRKDPNPLHVDKKPRTQAVRAGVRAFIRSEYVT